MINDFQVPDEFLGAFRRLVRRMPVELQTDETFIQTLVMYLKLGGEKLASHRIEVAKTVFPMAFTIVKRQPIEDTAADNEDDDQDDDADRDGENQDDDGDSHSDDVEDIDSDTTVS